MIQSVGASWMMISIAQSADMVALVQASVTLPTMLLSLIAGAMADNLDRRKVMLSAQVFMLAVSVVLAICAFTGSITPWLLLSLTFLIGCGAAFNAPAWQASVGDMVSRAELPGAVALNSMGFNMARSVGPAIGGGIVAAAGAATAFAVNSVSYIALIVVLKRWRPQASPQALPRETLGIAVAAGIRYVAMSPAIRMVLVRSALFCIGASAVMALMPLVAKVVIVGGPLTYGLLLGAFGVGAVGGAFATARLRKVLSTEAIVRYGSIAFAVAAAGAALSPYLLATMAVLMLAGAGWVLTLSTFNVAVQMAAPRWVVARALSMYQMSAFGGLAAGSWAWGNVAASQGREGSVADRGGRSPRLGFVRALAASRAIGRTQPRSVATMDRARHGSAGSAAHRSGRGHRRVHHPARRRNGIPRRDGRTTPDTAPRRGARLEAVARPRGPTSLD